MTRPRVILLRGRHANLWDLRPWELLAERFEVSVLVGARNEHDISSLAIDHRAVRSVRDGLPRGRIGNAAAYVIGERYLGLDDHLQGADIVHAAELHTWFSAQAAGLRRRLGFRLILSVWETIPFLDAYRWPRERRHRRAVLGSADLLLPATERARRALLLEGIPPERLEVCPPGIDLEHFTAVAESPAGAGSHVILSPGRLVWEKGHQDVIRAVAALRRGLLGEVPPLRLIVVGSGPEQTRLRRHAAELGVAADVEFRPQVPYSEMPGLYRSASAMVLASLPRRGWEEQFGMVLAEAMACGTAVLAADSGAIPEVVGGDAVLFQPGDWYGLARALRDGPLQRPPAARAPADPDRVEQFSTRAASARLAAAYERALAGPGR
jgi:glycosyltransferase involved in cell wall biosynthesis